MELSKQPQLVTILQDKQKELGIMIIIEMNQSNATRGKVETEIINPKGRWRVTTTIVPLPLTTILTNMKTLKQLQSTATKINATLKENDLNFPEGDGSYDKSVQWGKEQGLTLSTKEDIESMKDDDLPYGTIKSFIKSEQSNLLREILEKSIGLVGKDEDTDSKYVLAVSVEDIHSVAKEWGIEI